MDVVALHQAGFVNAVATLGTSLTAEQARMISQYAEEVIVAYDADGAGQKATNRAINIFGEIGLKVRVLKVKDAKDPDEFIKNSALPDSGCCWTGRESVRPAARPVLRVLWSPAMCCWPWDFQRRLPGAAFG